jgi:putative transposase
MNPKFDPQVPWPHAPVHRLGQSGIYFVTAGTYRKEHHFRGAARLEVLHRGLLKVATEFGWRLEAWAVFSNHYHFIGNAPESAESLRPMLSLLHERTAKWVNRLDAVSGRKVWHNYRETHLTFERSYFARLNYVHRNAVKHGLVKDAVEYPWCSASWFEQEANPATRKTIQAFKTDQLQVPDEYDVAPEW